ncbi:MAG: hypothetical protein PHH54_04000 [Candidatus Nanoarchaeia archaeon]|nr:hypothetical protein [Candidatus Nanoarchaeia archaeon]MDD5741122.1 hypothetical protein [Candidatus Nanoarchaeia archaeon]
MKSEKRFGRRVVLSLLLIGIIIVSISFVSAAWWNSLFGSNDSNLEGELAASQAATARVRVQDTSAPIVVYVSDTNPNPVTLNSRQVSGGNVSVRFWFLAQQGATGPGNLGVSTSSSAYFNKTGVIYTRANVSCVSLTEVNCGTFCTGTAMNYSCTIVMRYYDNSSTWSINATVVDGTTGSRGSNITKTFSVNSLSVPFIETIYLNWTNPALALSTQNRYSDNNISVLNDGNQNINSANVNATFLNGTTRTEESIPPSRFTVNNAASSGATCGGNTLVLDAKTSVPGYYLPKTDTEIVSSVNFTACLTSLSGLIPSLSSQEYNASRLWGIEVI